MGKGVFLGLATVDILNYVSRYPESNEKIRANQQLVFAGGPSTNAAVAFAALGNDAQLITGLGNQPIADIAKEDLRIHRVKLLDIPENNTLRPVLSAVTIDENSGDRSVVYTDTAQRELLWVQQVEDVLYRADILMLDGYYIPHAVRAAKVAKKRGIPVIFDGGSWKDGVVQLLPLIDFAICSNNFTAPGCPGLVDTVACLHRLGVKKIAVSRGPDDMYISDCHRVEKLKIRRIKATDTLGAGDILHGAFCHYVMNDDFISSMEKAARVATESCRYRGTREWIRHLQ